MKQEILAKRKELAQVVPSSRQYAWQELEFYCFFHFGMNTFTNKEWGDGTDDPKTFNPEKMDAEQWISSVKEAGIKGVLLTCKHHDGFCLWPSRYTEYSLKNSPYKNGTGDIVKEVSEACQKYGLKFGVYLSPWDRHEKTYGTNAYNDYFIHQLTELLTQYGEIFSVWFDGACGEGPNGKKQVYDWQRYYDTIRKLQPNAVIAISGPDVRWIGNEGGHTRKAEWSVVPQSLYDQDKIQENSQSEDSDAFRERMVTTDEDLGSFEKIKDVPVMWWPAEVDVSIRPGWFHHPEEDDKVRSLDNLMNIYFRAVGGNAALLLNIPPTKEGLLHANDVTRLKEVGTEIKRYQQNKVMAKGTWESSFKEDKKHPLSSLSEKNHSYFEPVEKIETGEIVCHFENPVTFNIVSLREYLPQGQRVENYSFWIEENGVFVKVASGTTIGWQKLLIFPKNYETMKIKLKIESARWCPILEGIHLYHDEKIRNENSFNI